jgi:hypothetical protein
MLVRDERSSLFSLALNDLEKKFNNIYFYYLLLRKRENIKLTKLNLKIFYKIIFFRVIVSWSLCHNTFYGRI